MARGFETTTGLVIQQGIFEQSSTAKHKIGTRMQLADGRVFYYAKAGGTLAAGTLLASVVTPSGHNDVDTSAVAVDGKSVTVTLNTTSIAEANLYGEGWIATRQTGGVGQMLKIKSHPICSDTTGTCVLTLYDPVKTALLATGQADLLMNPFKDVITHDTVGEPAAGVSLIAITDNYHFWCQTWGPACVLAETSATLGAMVCASAADGAIQDMTTITTDITYIMSAKVGQKIGNAGADGVYGAVNLMLYP
jgi:hypothetical protein